MHFKTLTATSPDPFCSGKISRPEDFDKYIIPNQTAGGYYCSLCLQFTHVAKSNVRNHVESKHFPNSFVYNCEQCGHSLGTKKALQRHKARCKSGLTGQSQNILYWLLSNKSSVLNQSIQVLHLCLLCCANEWNISLNKRAIYQPLGLPSIWLFVTYKKCVKTFITK